MGKVRTRSIAALSLSVVAAAGLTPAVDHGLFTAHPVTRHLSEIVIDSSSECLFGMVNEAAAYFRSSLHLLIDISMPLALGPGPGRGCKTGPRETRTAR